LPIAYFSQPSVFQIAVSQWEEIDLNCLKFEGKCVGMMLATVRETTNPMKSPQRTAWLIGTYTDEIDSRVRSLGYRIDNYFADSSSVRTGADEPGLIVISDDHFTDALSFELIRELYPDTLLISLPSTNYYSMNPDFHQKGKQSVARLVNMINERVFRWDN
jgi:hypothetical protein